MEDTRNLYNQFAFLSPPRGFRFDLQLFAAEDEGRTEEPTEKKIREAREKGQVARTQELPQAIVVLAGFTVIFFLGGWMYNTMAGITKYYLSSFSRLSLSPTFVRLEMLRLTLETAKILMPVFAASFVAAFLGNVIQVGWQMSSHPLNIDFSKIKIDPASMMKKIFISKQVAMNLFKSLFKILVIGIVSYIVIAGDFEEIMRTPDFSVAAAFSVIGMSALKIIIWTSILLLILSVPDYFFQRQELMESLKMKKQEIKEEMKETQGDPHMRGRLREMQRDLSSRNMIREVPKADVIVTNPTHYAVALQYTPGEMEAPMVIAKGVDSMALYIRRIAREHNIPVMENRPLAQQMYKSVDVGDIIPEELFRAVTAIYSELYKKKQFRRAI